MGDETRTPVFHDRSRIEGATGAAVEGCDAGFDLDGGELGRRQAEAAVSGSEQLATTAFPNDTTPRYAEAAAKFA